MGRPRRFASAKELEKTWEKYKTHCDNQKALTHEFSAKNSEFVSKELKRSITYTIEGFCVYAGISRAAFYERYGYEGGTDRPACEPWSIMRALADGGVDWAAEPFSDMAGKAAPGPGAASVVSEQSMREEHDVLPKGETASHEGMYDERG